MLVQIRNFKCWDNLDIDFPKSGVVYLKGNTGQGKTTLINAIAWCFYGKVRKIAPNPPRPGMTSVSIQLENIFIRRIKPKHLTVQYKGNTYKDDEAQSIIDDLFGTHEMWTIASCFKQCIRNGFLTSPLASRMDYLHLFAFRGENPPEYMKKLGILYTKDKTKYTETTKLYDGLVSSFTPIKSPDLIDEEAALHQLETLNFALKDLETRQIEIGVRKRRVEAVKNELAKLKEPVCPLNPNLEDEKVLEGRLAIKKARDEFYKKWPVAPKQPASLVEDSELELALINKGLYDHGKKKTDGVGVAYDKKTISSELERIKSVLESQPYLIIESQIKSLPSIEYEPESIVYVDIESLKNERSKLEAQIQYEGYLKKSVQCPECSVPLYVETNPLKLSSVKVVPLVDSKSRLASINSQISNLEEIQARKKEMEKVREKKEELELQLASLSPPTSSLLLTPSEEKVYRSKLATLSSVKIIPEPKVEQLKQLIAQRKIYEEYASTSIDLDTEVFDTDLADYIAVKKYNEDMATYQYRLDVYRAKVETLSRDLVEVDEDHATEIEALKSTISNLEDSIARSKQVREMKEIHTKIKTTNEQLKSLYEEMENENELRSILEWSEKSLLQSTIDSINSTVEFVCRRLFEEEITFEFCLEKENKTNKKTKRGVEIRIYKNGGVYDFEDISWGEQDRVSYALTLAFNYFSSFPVLLADEPFAFIHAELKEQGLEIMKEMSVRRPIVITGQGFVEGGFDAVIDLGEHR